MLHMTLVVVDQDRVRLTELTKLLLEAFPGSVIYQHTDPLRALLDVRRNRVDAVYVQLDMGGVNGVELAGMLHLEQTDLPVFLVRDAEQTCCSTLAHTATTCLTRPLSVELLQQYA